MQSIQMDLISVVSAVNLKNFGLVLRNVIMRVCRQIEWTEDYNASYRRNEGYSNDRKGSAGGENNVGNELSETWNHIRSQWTGL